MVKEFHAAIGHPIGEKPERIPDGLLELRIRLIVGEVTEMICAMIGRTDLESEAKEEMLDVALHLFDMRSNDGPDLVGVADGACDSHVVISGTSIVFGIPEDEVYEEVHRTNMAKVGGPVRADGKQLKPEGWQPPDIKAILDRHA